MLRRTRILAVLVTIVAGGACSDTITSTTRLSPHARHPRANYTPAPGEEWPSKIHEATATLTPLTAGGYTTLNAEMVYDGTNAFIGGTSQIRESSGAIVTQTHPEWSDQTSGFRAHHWATYEIIVQSTCGALVQSSVSFRAVFEWLNASFEVYNMDETKTSRGSSVVQAECAPCPAGMKSVGSVAEDGSDACAEEREGERSGGGGSDCPDCVLEPTDNYCRVRYTYDKTTGEILRWSILWCS